MAEEYTQIDKDNYEIKAVVQRVNLPQVKARKELLTKIRDISEQERIEIVQFDRNQHMDKSYTDLIDEEIAKIDTLISNCK